MRTVDWISGKLLEKITPSILPLFGVGSRL